MITVWLKKLYKTVLFLYPPRFRAEFGEEMQEVFDQAVIDCSHKGGLALVYLCLGELASLPASLLNAHQTGRLRGAPSGFISSPAPVSFSQSWQELLLALAVFLLPAGLILINQPFQKSAPLSLLAGLLFLAVMMLVGWLGGAELRSLANIGILLVIATYLVLFQWVAGLVAPALISDFSPGALDRSTYLLLEAASRGMLWLMLFCLTLLIVALLAIFNRFQPLLHRVRHDWTLVSYILYGESLFALLLLFESQRFNLSYAIASLLCLLAGLWFFLRSPVRWVRLLAMLTCLTLAVGIAALDQWPLQSGAGWLTWSQIHPSDAGRLLLSWVWMVAALLLPGLLARLPSRGRRQSLAG